MGDGQQVEFVDDFKPMRDTALQRVRGVDGVAWAVPMYKNYLRTRLPDGTLMQTRDRSGWTTRRWPAGRRRWSRGSSRTCGRDRAVLINVEQAATTLRAEARRRTGR